MVDECGTTTFRYASFGGVLSEDGPWGSDTVTYSYDDGRRRREMDLEQFNSAAWVQNYTYDSLGRLTNTISPAGPFQYTYSRGYTDAFRDNDNTPDNVTAGGQVE